MRCLNTIIFTNLVARLQATGEAQVRDEHRELVDAWLGKGLFPDPVRWSTGGLLVVDDES